MKRTDILAVVLGVTLGVMFANGISASAHTGSPSMVTWSNGSTLTSADLNSAFAHIHNTFSAGILDANISSSAAIAHSKLATPALVAKAVLQTSTACDGAQATGTDCTTGVEQSRFLSTSGGSGSGNSALEAGGAGVTAGVYNLTLAYTPSDTDFIVLVSSGTTSVWCSVTGKATTAPHLQVSCENDASTPTNTNINVVVFDAD